MWVHDAFTDASDQSNRPTFIDKTCRRVGSHQTLPETLPPVCLSLCLLQCSLAPCSPWTRCTSSCQLFTK
jgi:hypothetical protein